MEIPKTDVRAFEAKSAPGLLAALLALSPLEELKFYLIKIMKYFLDTEFIEDGKTIDLISIGIVAEDDRLYYALNFDCDHSRANEWVKENVLSHIPEKPTEFLVDTNDWQRWRRKSKIAEQVKDFLLFAGSPEMWADYASYDWVVLCQLYGEIKDLPAGFPMCINDTQQFSKMIGSSTIAPKSEIEHHALSDAFALRDYWQLLDGELNAIFLNLS